MRAFMNCFYAAACGIILALPTLPATYGEELQAGVRGLATRAPKVMKIDGDLQEFEGAFCTPVNYFHPNPNERAAQFFYMWDDEAFYAGLRTLDTKQANPAPDNRLWEGDGVEWYFDTRRGDKFRDIAWGPGAVHMYWTGYKNADVKPRWCLRPDMLQAIPGEGIEVGARKTTYGAEVEFKLPWKNFPDFKPAHNEVIALDSELCYSDGAGRTDRTFAYGSPLSVQQPASQGKIQLVEQLEASSWKVCGPVMLPIRCDTPWSQPARPMIVGKLALPPDHQDEISKVLFRVVDLAGKTLGEFEGKRKDLNLEGRFVLAEAHWPNDLAPPGGFQLVGVVLDKEGSELTRVAPRLVSVGMQQGY